MAKRTAKPKRRALLKITPADVAAIVSAPLSPIPIELGTAYTDTVTKFTGDAVGLCWYLGGNVDVLLRAVVAGELREHWFGMVRLKARA